MSQETTGSTTRPIRFGDEVIDVVYRKAASPESNRLAFPPLHPEVVLEDDVLIERDVAFTLSDGTMLYLDVYRPDDDRPVPAILSWSWVGKSVTYKTRNRTGIVPDGAASDWAKMEGLDPAYWCHYGYAVVNADARGVNNCDGDIAILGSQDGRDAAELVEHLAAQPWCNGRVAMAGNAFQGNSAWFAAAEKPAHLVCIAPLESYHDMYEVDCRGGIPNLTYLSHLVAAGSGNGYIEDLAAMAVKYPLRNAYWQDKVARIENIEIPIYTSVSTNLMQAGLLDAFDRAPSAKKWLRMHTTISWRDIYEPANLEDLRLFFDRYLKNIHNGWEFTPKVRMSLHDSRGDVMQRPENQWLPARARERRFPLDAADLTMRDEQPTVEATTSYQADGNGQVTFTYTATEELELAGFAALRLWIEVTGADDTDLFVAVQRFNADGTPMKIAWFGQPHSGNSGSLRASLRELDAATSTPSHPRLRLTTEQKLVPGEVVPVDIPLQPFAFRWHAGEQLRIVITDSLKYGGDAAGILAAKGSGRQNQGAVVLHTGGCHDAALVAQEIPAQ